MKLTDLLPLNVYLLTIWTELLPLKVYPFSIGTDIPVFSVIRLRLTVYINHLCRKFVRDAIPMVGTGASVKLMKTLISNDDVTGADADMWLASLAFIHHPTDDMIKEIRVS